MNTRIRRPSLTDEETYSSEADRIPLESAYDLSQISDEDIQAFLEEQEEEKPQPGFWNLPTIAGLSIITVGVGYLLQAMGLWGGFDLAAVANALPWLAGILIILLGFGVLGWKPRRKKKAAAKKAEGEKSTTRDFVVEEIKVKSTRDKKRLMRSDRNKKVLGVAGGIGEYFGFDPTLVRIAFVIATIFGSGFGVPLYILLAFIMPKPDSPSVKGREERITIIREHP